MSDIFGALLGDQAGWPKCKHEQKQRENHDVDQSRIKELGRVAFDQADNDPGNDRPLDISKPPDNNVGKGLTITDVPANGVSTSTGPSSAPLKPASAEA